MGIIKLTKFFNEYINSLPKTHPQIISEICYIDYTANLVITTSNVSKKYSKYPYLSQFSSQSSFTSNISLILSSGVFSSNKYKF